MQLNEFGRAHRPTDVVIDGFERVIDLHGEPEPKSRESATKKTHLTRRGDSVFVARLNTRNATVVRGFSIAIADA